MFVQIKKEKHVGMLGGAIMATLLETEGELSRAQQLQTQTTGVLVGRHGNRRDLFPCKLVPVTVDDKCGINTAPDGDRKGERQQSTC